MLREEHPSLLPFIDNLDKSANFPAKLILRNLNIDSKVYLTSYCLHIKPIDNVLALRQDLFTIPWTSIDTLKVKTPEPGNPDMKAARLKIKIKSKRTYILLFGEKDPQTVNNVIKNVKYMMENFTLPQYFYCFEVFGKLKSIEQAQDGWNIYNLVNDFKM